MENYPVKVIGRNDDTYLLSARFKEEDILAPAVTYDVTTKEWSKVMALGIFLKFNPYFEEESVPFTPPFDVPADVEEKLKRKLERYTLG